MPATRSEPSRHLSGCLRLGHFGNVYESRLPIGPFLDRLAMSGFWREVELHQYGLDSVNALTDVRHVRVVHHSPIPWSAACRAAGSFDAALVIGNIDPKQLPSKAIDYLTLPVPRVAVVGSHTDDALSTYVSDKPGWLVVSSSAPDAAASIHAHVASSSAAPRFAVPDSETWDNVVSTVTQFVRCVVA
jgi:hypothetical protein